MDEPEEHDYPSAIDYLTLLMSEAEAERAAKALRGGSLLHRKAKDLLRASRLPLLEESNPHVAADLEKVRKGKKLSPVLLVRGDASVFRPLHVADGYHRICASFHIDENADIPCRICDLPKRGR
jgi:hypothetical protein